MERAVKRRNSFIKEWRPKLVFHIGHLADLFSKTPRLKKLAASDRSIKAVSECDDELKKTHLTEKLKVFKRYFCFLRILVLTFSFIIFVASLLIVDVQTINPPSDAIRKINFRGSF